MVLTSVAADNIGSDTIYFNLGIIVCNKYKKSKKPLNINTTNFIIIINKINIVQLNILSNIGKYIIKACNLLNNNFIIFKSLLVTIFIFNFY